MLQTGTRRPRVAVFDVTNDVRLLASWWTTSRDRYSIVRSSTRFARYDRVSPLNEPNVSIADGLLRRSLFPRSVVSAPSLHYDLRTPLTSLLVRILDQRLASLARQVFRIQFTSLQRMECQAVEVTTNGDDTIDVPVFVERPIELLETPRVNAFVDNGHVTLDNELVHYHLLFSAPSRQVRAKRNSFS